METLNKIYSPKKTARKFLLPCLIPVLVEIVIAIAKANGIEIDKTIAYSIASAGFGAVVGFVNWVKNHKK